MIDHVIDHSEILFDRSIFEDFGPKTPSAFFLGLCGLISRHETGVFGPFPLQLRGFFGIFSLEPRFLALTSICELGRGWGSLLIFSLGNVNFGDFQDLFCWGWGVDT
jgi:hypothetical protein